MPRKQEINQSGSAVHLFNCFRSDALSQILNDLLSLERHGLKDEVCNKIQGALGVVINEATSIPDGSFISKPLWRDIQNFNDVYVKWNGIRGDDSEAIERRRDLLRALREKRHKIAKRARVNQYILSNELDLQVVHSMYGALTQVFSAFPDLFKNLGKAISRYEVKRALAGR
jgi:hypothetical protein